MADATWVPPQITIGAPSANAFTPGRGTLAAGGAGTGMPVMSVFLSPAAIDEASAADTVVSSLFPEPSDMDLTLLNNPGGYFQIDGTNLTTTNTPTDFIAAPVIAITVRCSWGQKIKDIDLEVDVFQDKIGLAADVVPFGNML